MFDSAVILVADGDDRLRAFIAHELAADEATVRVAADLAQATARAATHRPDAMVLGRLDASGGAVGLIRTVRRSGGLRIEPSAALPILALIDDGDELGVLRAFDAGADDVAERTCSYAVLRARVRVLLGRSGRRTSTPTRRVGPLEVNSVTREVSLREQRVELSATEFALLSALLAEPTRVFTRQELLRDVWGFRSPGATRTVDSHVCRLRSKLRAQGDAFLVTVRGIGFRLVDVMPNRLADAA